MLYLPNNLRPWHNYIAILAAGEEVQTLLLLNCKDLDEAIEMAARIPDALTGSVEIRPVLEL